MAESPETKPDTPPYQSSSAELVEDQSPASSFEGLQSTSSSNPMCSIMYPALVPGFFPLQMDQGQLNRGPGLYAVPVLPFAPPITGFPTNTLIPFTYNIPTARSLSGNGEVGPDQGQAQPGEQPQQQQGAGPQRQVIVRRFQIAIQLDLLLILKLAAVIFLFNQDGSKQRLTLLVFFASLVYLYQTGALAPVIRWLSERTQRVVVRPRAPPRADIRGDNLPAADGQGNENAGLAGAQDVIADNEHDRGQVEAGNRFWGIVKEIQIIVFRFITSLLPGFNNLD